MTSTLGDIQQVTFSEGSFDSTIVTLGQRGTLEGIELPTLWPATDLTFKAAIDQSDTFKDIYDADGKKVTAKTLADCFIPFSGRVTRGVNFVKLVREKNTGEYTVKIIIRLP
jgi:hypothetical protein